MFSISIPFPTRQERRCSRNGRKKRGAGSGKPTSGGGGGAAAKPPRPRPGWDSTTSDLSRHRLTEAEMVSGLSTPGQGRMQRQPCPPPTPNFAAPPCCHIAPQEFRRTLRQGRHRLHSHDQAEAGQEEQEAAKLTAEVLERLQLQLRGGAEEGAAQAPAPAPAGADHTGSAGSADDGDADGGSSSHSLEGMREFVADLQRRYGLAPATRAAQHPPAPEWLHDQLAAHEAELGADGGDGCEGEEAERASEGSASGAGPRRRSTSPAMVAEAGSGSDSEGCGRLGPAALRRAQRRHAAAHGTPAAAPATVMAEPPQALLQRLATAEARLAELERLPAQLGEALAALAELRARNERLQTGGCSPRAGRSFRRCSRASEQRCLLMPPTVILPAALPPTHAIPPTPTQADMDDYVGHTSTLLTSLQTQMAGLLASQGQAAAGADLAAAGRLPPRAPACHMSATPPVAVMQAQAVAEALAIAQQARALSAGAEASPPATCAGTGDCDGGAQAQPERCRAAPLPALPRWRPDDALASVQLPPFRGFAELRGQVAAAAPPLSKPAPELTSTAPVLAAGKLEGSVGGGGSGGSSVENSPPQPRALPQSLVQHLGAGAASPASAGFHWRPLACSGQQ